MLRRLLDGSGLTVRQLAQRAGCSPGTVSYALRGVTVPREELFERLVRACDGEPGDWRAIYEQAAEAARAARRPAARTPEADVSAPAGGRHVTVAVIDDHPVVIEGLVSWIERDPQHRVHVVHRGGTRDEPAPAPAADADVVVLGLNETSEPVMKALRALAAQGRRVVVFSAVQEQAEIAEILRAGAVAFVARRWPSRSNPVVTISA
ncbi:helix-turn-helix domain-containing protein [Actinomadura sp. LD22]|uniref:Helix-turn-helix domain-containing protein n=1 Tax=Actinomadura physcomitrii TaxID=2650748 RepID=A0A6I4MTW5_9ACTN|nr:helix-turn-helix domain-containing protein [Actinomadura physcomitrii]MWA06129.1 helix-turn-helix domain-containing protein [Actinomadura physcomitrii]